MGSQASTAHWAESRLHWGVTQYDCARLYWVPSEGHDTIPPFPLLNPVLLSSCPHQAQRRAASKTSAWVTASHTWSISLYWAMRKTCNVRNFNTVKYSRRWDSNYKFNLHFVILPVLFTTLKMAESLLQSVSLHLCRKKSIGILLLMCFPTEGEWVSQQISNTTAVPLYV